MNGFLIVDTRTVALFVAFMFAASLVNNALALLPGWVNTTCFAAAGAAYVLWAVLSCPLGPTRRERRRRRAP